MREKALSLPALACMHAHMHIDNKQPIVNVINHLSANGTEQVALIIITLHFDSECTLQAASQIQPSISYYQEHLRRFIRKTDQILLNENTIYIFLPKALLEGAELVQNRLWEAMLWHIHNAGEQNFLQPSFMSIGHSAYPHPNADVLACIQTAEAIQLRFEVQPENPVQAQPKDDAAYILARQLGIPYLSLLPRTLSPRVLQIIQPQLAQELRCYPIGRARDTLTVAMSDPRDEQALTRLEQETGLRIFPVVVSSQELQTALEQFV